MRLLMVRVNSGGSRDGRSARDSLNRMAGSNRLCSEQANHPRMDRCRRPAKRLRLMVVGAKAKLYFARNRVLRLHLFHLLNASIYRSHHAVYEVYEFLDCARSTALRPADQDFTVSSRAP